MLGIVDTIKKLPKMRGFMPASEKTIADAETQLCLKFADEYKTYLKEFGEASAYGMELTGILEVDYLNVVRATKEKWELYPQVPHNLYVIEDTTIDGIVIWQNESGEIYQTRPNKKAIKIADNLVSFLEKRFNLS
jgi:hypothetical protein